MSDNVIKMLVLIAVVCCHNNLIASPLERPNNLYKIIEQRSNVTGERVVVTRNVIALEKDKTDDRVLATKTKVIKSNGWTIFASKDEKIESLRENIEHNLSAWDRVIHDKVFKNTSSNMYWGYADAKAIAMTISYNCGVQVNLNFSRQIQIVAVDSKGANLGKSCRSYMVILAVNGILVRNVDGKYLVGEILYK